MFSVIMVYFKNNDETRENAFKEVYQNIKNQTFQDFELIVVTPENGFDLDCKHIKLNHPFVYNGRHLHRINKSWCMNVGVRNASYDSLVFVDADMRFGCDYFRLIDEFSQDGRKMFTCYDKIICERGRDNPEERVQTVHGLRTAGGVWFIQKDFFWDVGGMNESYFGYGGEDNDFWQRANYLLGSIDNMSYTLTHIYHHWHSGLYSLNPERAVYLFKTVTDIPASINRLKELQLGGEIPQPIYE